jgi:methylenetetrahydrofolate reductase (NADPH)
LDVQAVHGWLDHIAPFNTLPIHLGIPGPMTPAMLLKFARICDIKNSLLGLRRQGDRIGKLLTVQTPDYLVDGLAGRIDHFHLYRAHLRSLELSGNLERTLLYCNPHGLFQ